MEIRKIQRTGGSSFIVTLPKNWIKQLNIKEKDSVLLVTQPDGTLLISPDINKENEKSEKVIEVNGNTNTDFLFRLLIGSYIGGFGYIIVRSAEPNLTPKIRKTITDFKYSVIGFEIIDETKNSITLKDLLNPAEMPFDKSLKRMSIGVVSMHEDVMLALRNADKKLAEDVIARDLEINRRYRLMARQSNMILQNVVLARKMGVTLGDAHHYFLIGKQLERIGDHAKILAKNVIELIDKELPEKLIEDISTANRMSLDALENSMRAWELHDLEMANNSIERVPEIKAKCAEITSKYRIDGEIYVHIGFIAESIGRIGEYAANIAEIVFDNLLKNY